jgi:nucleoid-associated protein YgaU
LEEISQPAAKQADNSAAVEKHPKTNIEETTVKQSLAAPQMPTTPQQVKPEPQPAVPEPDKDESAPAAAPEKKQVLPAAQAKVTATPAAKPQESAAVNAVTVSSGDDEPDEKLSNIPASSVKKAEQKPQAENIAVTAPAMPAVQATPTPQTMPAAPKEPVKAAFKENKDLKRVKQPQKAKAPEKKGASKMHTVERGDNLQSLAQKYYNDKSMWLVIYEANKDKIEKGSLETGQLLLIP